VTSGTGKPARNICVIAFAAAASGVGVTGKTGRYTISSLNTGSYGVQFVPCVSSSRLVAVTRRTTVRVVAPRAVSGVSARLRAGGSVAGAVRTGSPAGAAGVCAEALPLDPDSLAGTSLTGRNGNYAIHGLAPGAYQVFFGDPLCFPGSPPLATQWYDGQQARPAATVITVAARHTTAGIGATMLPEGTVSGTVTGPSATAVSGARVTAMPLAGGSRPVLAVTAAGSYSLIDLPAGQYKVKFGSGCGATGLATQWWQDARSSASATFIAVTPASVTTGIGAKLAH
jgi:hypothetical protein